jgi:hypothetical protein
MGKLKYRKEEEKGNRKKLKSNQKQKEKGRRTTNGHLSRAIINS